MLLTLFAIFIVFVSITTFIYLFKNKKKKEEPTLMSTEDSETPEQPIKYSDTLLNGLMRIDSTYYNDGRRVYNMDLTEDGQKRLDNFEDLQDLYTFSAGWLTAHTFNVTYFANSTSKISIQEGLALKYFMGSILKKMNDIYIKEITTEEVKNDTESN